MWCIMAKTYKYIDNDAYAMQRLAREEMKLKLLADIAMDVQICQLEGWDYKSYIVDLVGLLSRFVDRE